MASENNKRIAKNTLMLYFRMLLTMGISLYTVRVVLDTLGTVDYGIYNVVGGVVTMFSFFSSTMAVASQRYFSFELGRNDKLQFKKTFSMTVTIYAMIAMIIIILAETIGLWFVNTQMSIPTHRMNSANWIYQFAIFSFVMTMFKIPYNAAIIAHEKMSIYAWVSIIEVSLKLLIVFLLLVFSFDKLKLYGMLVFGVTAIVTFIYMYYCVKKFEECRFLFYWRISLFKELLGYSGWNLFGSLAGIFNNQGLNIMLNIFFGPVVNAARGISYQINNSINQFVQNFMTATNPQIIKYYAAGEKEKMLRLVQQSSKISFFLLYLISLPILLETKQIFEIWLKEVPEYTVLFTRLIIVTALIDSLSFSLMTAAQATGNLKKYTAVVGGIMLLNLPVSYLFLLFGFGSEIAFYISIINSFVCLVARIIIVGQMVSSKIVTYYVKFIPRLVIVSSGSYVFFYQVKKLLNDELSGHLYLICSSILLTSIAIFLFGFDTQEKEFVLNMLNRIKQNITGNSLK